MARHVTFPEETYVGLKRIRDTALLRFDSLFTPDRPLWTLAQLRAFHGFFVGRWDAGEGTFFEKLRKQLDGADDDVLQLAAELLYVQQFFTAQIGSSKKIQNVQVVLGWRSQPLVVPEWAVEALKRGLAGDQAFNVSRAHHVAWLTEYLIHWHEMKDERRQQLLAAPWEFAVDVRGVGFDRGFHQPMQGAWLYMIFPDSFESISSRKDKRLIRAAFQDRLPHGPTENIDADLLEIRQRLDQEYGEDVPYYSPPLIDRWRRPPQRMFDAMARPSGVAGHGRHEAGKPIAGEEGQP